MDVPSRRVYLEAMVESTNSDAIRLRALELLDDLDRREPSASPQQSLDDEFDDWQKWDKTIELIIEGGFCDEQIEVKAQQIATERLREEFGIVEGAEELLDRDSHSSG